MRMITEAFNSMRDLTNFVNDNALDKKDIINILQTKDGLFLLSYYAE